jgi:predicted transposase YbfD/YdcC
MDTNIPTVPHVSLLDHYSTVVDPRVERTRKHLLTDLLTIAICGFICGVDNWVELEDFGKAKREWFQRFLRLPHGIPSHDTFGRFFAALDPEEFSRCFMRWVKAISEVSEGEVVAIDGKTLRRSFDNASGKAAIHMVSAWASKNSLVLGQVKTEEKSNEITAIPKLLELLYLRGCIVTIDAMGCQREIVERIVEKEADYVISLKGNQGALQQEVELLFTEARAESFETVPHAYTETLEKDHGRIERRRYWTTGKLDSIKEKEKWPSLTSVGMVESHRTANEITSTEVRYFISSLPGDDAEKFADAVRSHWSVENNLHWVLDVAFDEDQSRVRKDNAPENMAMLRHVALNLIKADKLVKRGIQTRRKLAGWDENFLAHLLGVKGSYTPPPTGRMPAKARG